MKKPKSFVSESYLRKTAEILNSVKAYTYDLIIGDDCGQILDVGCGPGVDTIALAENTNPSAKVFGIDQDSDMIRHAKTWAFSKGVDHKTNHQVADITDIPFENNFFDVVRSERLFQHLSASDQWDKAFKECLRVLKKNGLFIIADTDWASASLDFPNPSLERKMTSFFAEKLITNGYSGRQLFRYFRKHALSDIQVKLIPVHFKDLAYTPYGPFLVEKAKASGLFHDDQLKEWTEVLEDRNDAGQFYCSLNMVVVSGRKD